MVQSASSFRSCTAFAATFSAMTIFIFLSLRSKPLQCVLLQDLVLLLRLAAQRASRLRGLGSPLPRSHDRLAHFRIDLLCGPQSSSKFYRPAHLGKHLLQRANRGNRIQIVVITKMGNAEKLPLHLSLSVGHNRAKVIAECLHDVA